MVYKLGVNDETVEMKLKIRRYKVCVGFARYGLAHAC
jgi:hypothetical protein